jgi:CarboxypepD_reg-like domain/TonB-dependent Receptor Plug Domain
MKKKLFFLALFLVLSASEFIAQNTVVFGRILDASTNEGVEAALIIIESEKISAESDQFGNYSINVKAGKPLIIKFSRLGYDDVTYNVDGIKENGKRYLNVFLSPTTSDLGVTVTAARIDDGGMVREQVSEFKILPTASGNFESILPSIALGLNAGSGGELSAQYNVRGGNYDENLVYINDFEIFRPQLIRAGQQEGLSFPNIDLIKDISFSSGGYDARYGNKMSSVLDIRYKRPDVSKASISASLLGATAHIEGSKRIGANAYNKLRYLIGARYKTNKYLLSSQETKGEYIPDFVDMQSYITYDLTRSLQVALIGNYNTSSFLFEPLSRTTTLGLITNTIRFNTAYEGAERDKFVHGLIGTSINFLPDRKSNPYFIKLLASRYSGSEQENFDILGYYRLSQIESDFTSEDFGKETALLGSGVQHRYARNYLYNEIKNVELKGGIELTKGESNHFLEGGIKYQSELYEDLLNEWERLDSAGYSLPYTGSEVTINRVYKTRNVINNQKADAFVQDKYTYNGESYKLKITGGLRASHTRLAAETFYSPRASIQYIPESKKNISYRLAWGIYYQSPFYREFRLANGDTNTKVRSQKSVHYVAGLNYDFMWPSVSKKPFKLISELYYKRFTDLIVYDVDNVRIAYAAQNNAYGYASGLDLRINGEFVPNAESWVNLSILTTKESILGVQHMRGRDTSKYVVEYVPRPTDRLFNISLFFQDYLPSNKNFKVNVSYAFGTGLPFGVKENNTVNRNPFRYKPYQRLDIGFSYLIWDRLTKNKGEHNPFKFSEKTWVSLEVYNIMDIVNTASVTWIRTITNEQYAINNNLTSRRVNLRFRMDF